ncbi:hypothetical protein, partial [Roseofilum sp. Guam]|uniref:hypothetical protein n=1 Tax=Roseofilum sp. Guam TaxID=2821502 RepID=UPI001B260A32
LLTIHLYIPNVPKALWERGLGQTGRTIIELHEISGFTKPNGSMFGIVISPRVENWVNRHFLAINWVFMIHHIRSLIGSE